MPRLTRRRSLELAGAATALAVLARPGSAGASFTQDVPLTGAPQAAPRFDLIGLDFGPAAHVHAEVRARRKHGPWTPWTPVHDATQPVWTGPADVFQVRYTGVARRLRARLTRTGPVPRPTARLAATRAAGQPDVIPRSAWGGDRLKPKEAPTYGTVQLAFVHHTVSANAYGPEDSAGIVLGICRYHRDHNGWNDIGYQFLVDKFGQVFEGRDGGIELAVVGAQAQGYNSVSTGVAAIGDHTSGALSSDGVEAVARLLAWKLSLHGVPVRGKVTVVSQGGASNRYAAGRKVTLQRISGHRDGDATSCPGEALYAQLGTIRARAAKLADEVSALTIAAARTEFTFPDTALTLTGALRLEDPATPAAGQPVLVEYQKRSGRPWKPVIGGTTDAAGAFAVAFPLPGSGRVRAQAAGLASAPIQVAVLPKLRLNVNGRRFIARVDPPTVTRGTIVVDRRVGRRWVRVKRIPVRFSDGAARVRFRPSRRGRYRVTLSSRGASVRRPLIVRA